MTFIAESVFLELDTFRVSYVLQGFLRIMILGLFCLYISDMDASPSRESDVELHKSPSSIAANEEVGEAASRRLKPSRYIAEDTLR